MVIRLDQPGPGDQIMAILASLGESVSQVADPQRQAKEEFTRHLLSNPELARGLERQLAGERAQQGMARVGADIAAQMGGMGGQVGDVAGESAVGAAGPPGGALAEMFGFKGDPREFAAIVDQTAPPLTPEERESRETSQAALDEELPRLRAEREKRVGERDIERAEFEIEYLDNLDPEKKARAENATAESQEVLAGLEQRQGENYLEVLERVENGEIPGYTPEMLAIANQNPAAMSAKLRREGMDLQERLARMRMLQQQLARNQDNERLQQELAQEQLATEMEITDRIKESRDRVIELREGEGNDSEIEAAINDVNVEIARLARQNPERATYYVGQFLDNWFGDDVNYQATPGFLGAVAEDTSILKPAYDLLADAGEFDSKEELKAHIRNDPDLGRLPMSMPEEDFDNYLEAVISNSSGDQVGGEEGETEDQREGVEGGLYRSGPRAGEKPGPTIFGAIADLIEQAMHPPEDKARQRFRMRGTP